MTEINEIFRSHALSETEDPSTEGEPCTSKREFLVDIINQGKADKLPGKTPWTGKRVKKATDKVVKKLHHEYHQADAKHKAKMTGKAVGAHVVSIYSKGVSRVLKIDSIEQLRKDIDSDPIIKDSMADLGALLAGTFGRILTPLLIAVHTANHTEGFVLHEEDKINDRRARKIYYQPESVTTKNHHNFTAFVERCNKTLAERLFKAQDAQELQNPAKDSKIWVKYLQKTVRRLNSEKTRM